MHDLHSAHLARLTQPVTPAAPFRMTHPTDALAAPVHVVIVDDDTAIRDLLRMTFDLEGYEVFGSAANGLMAIELLRACAVPCVVILDLQMPMLDGLGVLRVVAANATLAARYAFLLLTASGAPDIEALQAQVDRLALPVPVPVLSKPFRLATVLQHIQRLAAQLATASASVHDQRDREVG